MSEIFFAALAALLFIYFYIFFSFFFFPIKKKCRMVTGDAYLSQSGRFSYSATDSSNITLPCLKQTFVL